MKNRNNCNNHRNQKNHNPQHPKQDILPIPKPMTQKPHIVEIKVPTAEDYVTIPREEYDELIAYTTVLCVVEHLVETSSGSYGDYDVLRRVLDIANEDDAK